MTDDNFMDLDLELDAELQSTSFPTVDEEPVDKPSSHLVSDEPFDRFEALPRPSAIFLHGVDDLSTSEITSYVDSPLLLKVEWINDSACNLAFETPEDAKQVAAALVKTPTELDHRTLVPAKPCKETDLFIRISTDEDVKERGARAKSRYYQVHGIDGQEISKERQEARKQHLERMKQNGGDGRDVFSRLGQRRRSLSPRMKNRTSRSPENRRSRSPEIRAKREIPDHLKSRLGSKVKQEIKQEE